MKRRNGGRQFKSALLRHPVCVFRDSPRRFTKNRALVEKVTLKAIHEKGAGRQNREQLCRGEHRGVRADLDKRRRHEIPANERERGSVASSHQP